MIGISSGRCCPSAVQRDDELRAEAQRDVVAHAERQPTPAADRQLGDVRSRLACDGRGSVGRAVAHHHGHHVMALDHRGDLLDHRGDVLRLVERRADRDEPRTVGQPARAVPVESLLAERLDEQPDAPLRSCLPSSARAGRGRRGPRRQRATRRSRRRAPLEIERAQERVEQRRVDRPARSPAAQSPKRMIRFSRLMCLRS